MSLHSIAEDIVVTEAAVVATVTQDQGFGSMDLKGIGRTIILVDVGTYGSTAAEGTFLLKLQEANDNGSGSPGSFSDVGNAFVQYHSAAAGADNAAVTASGISIATTADVDNVQYVMSYTGSKRHIRVAADVTDATGNGALLATKVWYLGQTDLSPNHT